jgi:hypothetical protein
MEVHAYEVPQVVLDAQSQEALGRAGQPQLVVAILRTQGEIANMNIRVMVLRRWSV